ncbi:MAG: class I SAM-dependent DNA methyltransferase [Deltaproteobacteria bacterium]|nr:class I SAM-dependent DNA methyltransferase [Deltaproteobacteria bacterium]
MKIKKVKPRKALNKAFLKVKPSRIEIESFKANLIRLIDRINEAETEEFHKNLISDFLKDAYYKQNHFINAKGRNDLVICNGNKPDSSVGVIFEVKNPANKSEMITTEKLCAKAFYELTLYYLRERITYNNIEIKHLIITNINEWFIFDAALFERLFAQNKNFVKQFKEFEGGRLTDITTDFFYKQIAATFIRNIETEIEFAYFNLMQYQKPLRNTDKADDNKLIALFKLLSPEHLLKLPFANDSNSLDKSFYAELLHIIGLAETKKKGKKLIERNKKGKRNSATILESAIMQLDSLDKISRLDYPNQFGDAQQERLFNIGLELSITWINRILFLKLLEAQLIAYHKGDKSYAFLNLNKIKNYDDLNSLFFEVLAKKNDQRNQDVKTAFEKIPYLNSSLFEPTELEQATLFISNLKDDKTIPIISTTVLKDNKGKKRAGGLLTLEYLFKFLDAYDFASEGSEAIDEDNKTLINASVLGLIFEKINGYKDGSFFTPGFITMYMCRETVRKTVIQKFNQTKKWNCKNLNQLYNKIKDIKEANNIINDIKICDPAVGSGHFLVSALNEIIAVKNDLNILQDSAGRRLKEYNVEVVNDELIITDEDGELFEYNYKNKESQRIQETLFYEKKTIIENCLFGADINPNSVKICRLRLWIELLKNAYYKNDDELETLPNIDINIKCGNSLVSRFAIDTDLSRALRKSKWNIETYKIAVAAYRNADNKEQKREKEKLINEIKEDFRAEISSNDPKVKRLKKLNGDLLLEMSRGKLFEMSKEDEEDFNERVAKITEKKERLKAEIEAIRSNKIFDNAFEWRFEFPEVLNDNGDFIGFDIVIGNPPYIRVQELECQLIDYYKANFQVALKRIDISIIFIELSKKLLKEKGFATYITSNQFLTTEYGFAIRKFLKEDYRVFKIINFGDLPVFEEALTYVSIFQFQKDKPDDLEYYKVNKLEEAKIFNYQTELIDFKKLTTDNWILSSNQNIRLIDKLKGFSTLKEFGKSWAGLITGMDKYLMFDKKDIEKYGFENEVILPVIRANDCSKYYCNAPTKHVIYPYKFENGKTILLKEKELRIKYPIAYKYLVRNKSELLKRKDSRKLFADKEGWFSLTRFGQKSIYNQLKIVSPGEVKDHKFCIDRSGAGFSCARVFAITISNDELNINFVLAILNSLVTKFFIQSRASLKAGGYYSYSSNVLNQVPIKKISTKEQQLFIDLVQKIDEQKKLGKDCTVLEDQIDQLVYKLYNLTEEEIKIIENSVK